MNALLASVQQRLHPSPAKLGERFADALAGRLLGGLLGVIVVLGITNAVFGYSEQLRLALLVSIAVLVALTIERELLLRGCRAQLRAIGAEVADRIAAKGSLTVFEIFAIYAGNEVALHDTLFTLCALEAGGIVSIHSGPEHRGHASDHVVRAADVVQLNSHDLSGITESAAWAIATSAPTLRRALHGYQAIEAQCRSYHAIRQALREAEQRRSARARRGTVDRPISAAQRNAVPARAREQVGAA